MENNNSTKQVLFSVLGVAILVVAVVGVSFAFFTYTGQGTQENSIQTGTLTFNYKEPENGITIENALPMSDEEGKASADTDFEFTVTSNLVGNATVNYEIFATKEADSTLDEKYVKMYLATKADGSENTASPIVLNHYSKLPNATMGTGKKLTDGVVASGSQTTTYVFRMWLADTDADGEPVDMKDDVCTADGSPVDGEHPAVPCEEGESTVVEPGTNNKTFTVKINVYAKDSTEA